jgi:tetratricopeptide (TPR) repeat protein
MDGFPLSSCVAAMLLRAIIPLTGLVPILLLMPASARAQQKFTTQVMIVPVFRGLDRGLAAKASDIVRGRVAGAFPRSELRVISGGEIDDWLRLSGFDESTVLTEGELRELAKKFRADERITGIATRSAGRVHIDAALTLIRDLRLSQPLASDGASVNEAADVLARDAIAARRQFIPLRQCENFSREGKPAEAATAAAVGIAAYAPAIPTRACLLNALSRLEASPDSIISVARATLALSATNPIALERMAQALDAKGNSSVAAPFWTRLLATDSTNEDLIERVVNALSREGNAAIAIPLIDRGSDAHPDNLPLLKLRWLVHLAANDWKGAVECGERLLARDPATQSDPDFYSRLAAAYRADSQPVRALATVALGVSRFASNAPLQIAYLQLLKAEADAALPRVLAGFPDNAEVHALAAQSLKVSGNASGALVETKRALAANPRLPHGYLQLAQLEIDVGQTDSAYTAIELASKFGEDTKTVAQFALARGNALYKAATSSQKRDDFQRAMKFLALAAQLAPSAEAKFLLGASALSISQSAANEAPQSKSCDLSKLADSSLTEAEINLVGGGSAAPDVAKTYLDYVAKLRPYVADQLKSYCSPGGPRPR